MKELVISVLNISGQATIIFIVLLAVRGIFALGRVPKKYAYGLWAILFLRLLLPIQMEARWGLMPRESSLVRAVESMADTVGQGGQENVAMGNPAGDIQSAKGQEFPTGWQSMFEGQEFAADGQSMPKGQEFPVDWQSIYENMDTTAGQYGMPGMGPDAQPVHLKNVFEQTQEKHFSVWIVIVCLWAAGSVLLMGHGLLSYLRLKRKLCCSLRLEGWGEGIYLADGIETPFVLGFMAPGIYLPSSMADKTYPYVIAHECIHIKRRDYLIKLGAYLLTCLYWFHPLVWAGFILMSRDMEMSCDEAVLRRMNGDCRGEYADSLLQLTCESHYPAAAPLAFGEGDTRGRIKHIMGYRKAASAVVIAAVALTGILAAVLLTSPREAAAEEEDGYSPQDSPASELTEDNGISESSTVPGSSKVLFQVAYRDVISVPVPVMTGNTFMGADGAILDYADGDKIIFHGYFGLYIYSASAGETIGAVDLRALGCGDTQGDNTCQIFVSKDGSKVYFYPLGGISSVENSGQEDAIYSYVYDIQSGGLKIGSWNLEQPGDSNEKISFYQLMREELAESRAVPVNGWEQNAWEQGQFSDYGMIYEKGGEQILGYLVSASRNLEDLVYVQRPVNENNPDTVNAGSNQRKVVRLFGAEGQGISIASYGQEPTCITIDGTTYDLCQAMTECIIGNEMVELPQGNDSVNVITGLQCVDGLWIVESHVNPDRSFYSFYDPAAGEWVCHIVGKCLTWRMDDRDEKQVLWKEKRESLLSTVIYALDDKIYSLRDGLLAFPPPNPTQSDEADGQQEEIVGLYWYGDEVTVVIKSTQTEECRTVQYYYKPSEMGPGVIELE